LGLLWKKKYELVWRMKRVAYSFRGFSVVNNTMSEISDSELKFSPSGDELLEEA